MSEKIKLLDARRRRGTYAITTHSGTRYLVEVRKSVVGGMRVISDGSIKMLREGVVGGCGCPNDEPTIMVGQPMHLAERGSHIVMTSPIESIEKIEDGAIDALLCPRCKRGHKVEGQTCRLCHK